jgi:PTH1 family peptidyl-tRNA hydrolase
LDSGIALIAGLGNPGAEYANTRHNAGFRFLDALLAKAGGELRREERFAAEAGRTTIDGRDVWLLKPMTFMNRSGEAVGRFARYYRIAPGAILVAYDELDLPPGTVRLKRGGGDAGHNGVHDVIEKLGSPEFLRLRIGIGRPPRPGQGAAYVLRRAPAEEQALIDEAIARAVALVPDIVAGRLQQAMNALHAKLS